MKHNIFIAFLYILGLVYLLTPPKPLPVLSDSGASDEPGDTWQHPNQKGFYTNLTRAQILNDVQSKTKLTIFGITVPSFRLNYRPEEAGQLVRDQLKSNYLEEIIYPLHSSYFVNGWEPKNAPSKKEKVSELFLHGVPYDAKITLLPINSHPVSRVLIWSAIFPAMFFVKKSLLFSLKGE